MRHYLPINKSRYMKENKRIFKQSITFLLALMVLITSLPMGVAYAAPEEYHIKIMNEVRDGNGKYVNGAKYNIYKTHEWKNTGEYIKLSQRTLINKDPIVVSQAGTVFTVDEKGVYEIEQVERAPGYYAFGTFKENEEDKPLTMTVEFPKMENGVYADKQEIVVSPKLDPILTDVGLLKTGEDTRHKNNGLDGVNFKLVQTHSNSLDKLDKPIVITESLRTSGGGYIKLSNLSEGRYELHELGTAKLDGSSPEKIYADAEGTHLFDIKPIRFTVTADDKGHSVNVYKHNERGEKIEDIKKVDSKNNELDVDYYVEKKNYRVSSIEKLVEGKEDFYTNIGVPVEFTLKTKIPTNIEDYDEFQLVDVFDSRLDYIEGSTEVVIGKQSISDKKTVVNYDNRKKELSLELDLRDSEYFKKFAGEELTFSFKAKLNGNANVGEEIPNTATLEFDNGFGVDQTVRSNTVYVHPNEGSIRVIKVEKGNHNNKLSGAVFSLIDLKTNKVAKDVNGIEFRGITDGNGEIVFNKVPFGKYEIVEEKAPIGYHLSEERVEVTLDRNSEFLEYAFTIENERDKKVNPPGTNQDDPDTGVSGPIMMIGLGMMLIGVYLTMKANENKNKTRL